MKRILEFQQFLQEAERGTKTEKVHGLFEEDFLSQPFIKDAFGEEPDYDLDSDTERSPSGLDKIVWIEIKNPSEEAVKSLEADYTAFAKPFEEWAKKHGLKDPEILSNDDSMSFKITL